MHELIQGLISNDSLFGRIMTRIGTVIAANILFVLFSMPVVTAGAAFAALHHTMFKMLRSKDAINPFKQFWKGFTGNFKQATIAWLTALVLIVIGWINVRICRQAGGFIGSIRYGVYALGIILFIVLIYLFPTMAAFKNTIPNLMRNGMYFAFHKPWFIPVNLFFHIFPLYLTYSDPQMMPLYAFIWFFFGFGAIAMLTSRLLIKDFSKYLPIVDDDGDFILDENGNTIMPGSPEEKAYYASASGVGGYEKSEEEMIEELKKLDM